MRSLHWACLSIALLFPVAALTQDAPPAQTSPGLELLQQVALHYANARTYYIESIEERTSTSEYNRSYTKTILKASEAPGNRSYFEGRSLTGSVLKVSDGKTVWTYRIDQHAYTQKTWVVKISDPSAMISMVEMSRLQAEQLRKIWADLAKPLKSAELLPDSVLNWNGTEIPCHVVRVRTADEKRTRGIYA